MPEAKRDNAGKSELAELFHFDLEWLADHCTAGRLKYPDSTPGVPNWTLGGKPDEEYTNAIARHLAKFVRGEEMDEELGTHHLAAVAWNALALLTCNRNGRRALAKLMADPPSARIPTIPVGTAQIGRAHV